MQLTAAGRRCNIVHFQRLFERKNVNRALEWDNHIQIVYLGMYIVGCISIGSLVLRRRACWGQKV